MTEREVQTVSWINVVPHNRREKIARWWVESVRRQGTYTSRRSHEADFQTHVSVDQIDQLASDGLKKVPFKQKQQLETDGSWLILPCATADGEQYFGSVSIPTRPLNVRFTEQGIIPTE
jgi:hypothetical protein